MDTDMYESAHPDLPPPRTEYGIYRASHTTNLAGILIGKHNGWGVSGIAPDAHVVTWRSSYIASIVYKNSLKFQLKRGDVIVNATITPEKKNSCNIPRFENSEYGKDLAFYLTRKKGIHIIVAGRCDGL